MSIQAKQTPSRAYLLECFDYRAGELIWRVRPREHFKTTAGCSSWNAKYPGAVAGREIMGGYRQIGLCGGRHLQHRLIAAMFGQDVSGLIDHRDGDTTNNRIENLRPATQRQNMRNRKGWPDKVERVGVHKKPNGRFTAYVKGALKQIHLGTFKTYEEALSARMDAETRLYGEHAVSVSRGI